MFAAEVRHFCWQLLRGNVRAIEVLCAPPECQVFSSPDWQKLLSLLDPSLLLKKSFLDRALGQAVGAIVKKRKVNGRLVLREDISLTKFCDSFRYRNLYNMIDPVTQGCDILYTQAIIICAMLPTAKCTLSMDY